VPRFDTRLAVVSGDALEYRVAAAASRAGETDGREVGSVKLATDVRAYDFGTRAVADGLAPFPTLNGLIFATFDARGPLWSVNSLDADERVLDFVLGLTPGVAWRGPEGPPTLPFVPDPVFDAVYVDLTVDVAGVESLLHRWSAARLEAVGTTGIRATGLSRLVFPTERRVRLPAEEWNATIRILDRSVQHTVWGRRLDAEVLADVSLSVVGLGEIQTTRAFRVRYDPRIRVLQELVDYSDETRWRIESVNLVGRRRYMDLGLARTVSETSVVL